MQFEDLFSQQHIHQVLKTVLLGSEDCEILFLLKKNGDNGNFILNVKYNNVERDYILTKIHKNTVIEKESETKNIKVVYPVFVIESNEKVSYGAFQSPHEIDHFVSPEKNDLAHLKIILENLAEHQALELATQREDSPEKLSEYNLKDIVNSVQSLNVFKNLDTTAINKIIENLRVPINKLFDDTSLLVGSIGCPFAKNVCVNQNTNKSIFFHVSPTKLLPPTYDALLFIFALSSEKFRQEHFETLVLHYFKFLRQFLQKLQSNLVDKITRNYSEHHVKVLLPVVKFVIASSLLKLKDSSKLSEILKNICYFINYPLVNLEDIYEIIKNRIRTCDYDLLNYDLTSLSEKNGHLGQYFHLNIKIQFQGNVQELKLFAKFIITSTDLMQKVAENGPAKKEDFFYKTLIPIFINHGLESLLDFAPRCYLSRVNWLLVLDDLSRQGYVGFKPNVSLSYDGLKAVVENLAKLHSCSLLLEEILSKESENKFRFDEHFGEFLKEDIYIYGGENFPKELHESTIDCFHHVIEKLPEVSKNLNISQEKIKDQVKKSFLSIFSKIKKSKTIRNVVNHGDTYVSNMLFKFGEDKEVITNGLLIDFQILRYTTPCFDLLFFLYVASTKEIRDKYLKVLIEDYYCYITNNLKNFNFDPEEIFPREAFDQNVKYMKDAALVGAFSYALTMQLDPNFREEIFENKEKFEYYFLQNHRKELVDLSWEHEHSIDIFRGFVEDIAHMMLQNEF